MVVSPEAFEAGEAFQSNWTIPIEPDGDVAQVVGRFADRAATIGAFYAGGFSNGGVLLAETKGTVASMSRLAQVEPDLAAAASALESNVGPRLLPPHVPAKPAVQSPQHGTFYADQKGNVIPTPPGGRITGSPDGRFIQARDASGKPTGVRIDGGHPAATHADPRGQAPHGHVPGVTNPDGTPWLLIKQ
jgi:hypothetical protein